MSGFFFLKLIIKGQGVNLELFLSCEVVKNNFVDGINYYSAVVQSFINYTK